MLISNGQLTMHVLPVGAIIQRLYVPDRHDQPAASPATLAAHVSRLQPMHPGCNPVYPGCNPMYLRHGQLADISLGFDDADLARYTDGTSPHFEP